MYKASYKDSIGNSTRILKEFVRNSLGNYKESMKIAERELGNLKKNVSELLEIFYKDSMWYTTRIQGGLLLNPKGTPKG